MKINMNDPVTVTLTAHGAAVWNARYDGMPISDKYKPAPNAAGDTITAQLWSVVQVFGPGIHMGMPEVPFLNNTMDINNAENVGYYKAKMEEAERHLTKALAERADWKRAYSDQYQVYHDIAESLGAKLPFDLVNEVARRRMAEIADLQRQLADAIRERDQYKAACEMADAVISQCEGDPDDDTDNFFALPKFARYAIEEYRKKKPK